MKKAQVLIVEDDGIIAMDIESQLKQLGYGVTAKVAYGEEAIEKVKENKPDVVLMDIVLKGELDGIEAAEEIRTQFEIPVIFLTAFVDKDRLKRAKLTYPFGFIIKPFDNKDLEVTIEMALYIAKVDAERKQAEEMYRDLFMKAPFAYQSLNDDGKFIEVNFAWLNMMGHSRDEVIGKWFGSFLDSESQSQQLFADNFPCFKELGETTVEFVMLKKNGEKVIIKFEGKIGYNPDGSFRQTHCVLQDITKQKRSEEALRESAKKSSL